MKMIKGGAYLIKHDTYSHQGDLLRKGYAVILRDYDSPSEKAMIEFDGSFYWLSPEFLEPIDGDVPVDSEEGLEPAEYPPGTKLTSNRLFTIDEPVKPAHYDTGIDTIAFMRANCPPEQVEGFLRGNAIKYLQRYDRKSQALSDLKKSRHYIDMLIEELEGRA